MILAAEIPDGYLVAVIPVFVVAILGLFTWLVREMFRVTGVLDRLLSDDEERDKKLADHETRLRAAERRR